MDHSCTHSRFFGLCRSRRRNIPDYRNGGLHRRQWLLYIRPACDRRQQRLVCRSRQRIQGGRKGRCTARTADEKLLQQDTRPYLRDRLFRRRHQHDRSGINDGQPPCRTSPRPSHPASRTSVDSNHASSGSSSGLHVNEQRVLPVAKCNERLLRKHKFSRSISAPP